MGRAQMLWRRPRRRGVWQQFDGVARLGHGLAERWVGGQQRLRLHLLISLEGAQHEGRSQLCQAFRGLH